MHFKKAFGSSRAMCLLLMIAILAGMLLGFKPLLFLEYKAYDLMSTFRHRTTGSPVVIVALDDKSLKKIGDWPWPRSYIAGIIDSLSKSGAHTLGVSILYRSRMLNDGRLEIQNLRETLRENPPPGQKQSLRKIDRLLAESQGRLDHDAQLISAVRTARNVVLPLRFILSEPEGLDSAALSDWLIMNSIAPAQNPNVPGLLLRVSAFLTDMRPDQALSVTQIQQPYLELSRKAGALGHTNLIADPDNVVRNVPLFIHFQYRAFLSFALQIALKYSGARSTNIRQDYSGLQIKQL